MLIGLLAACSMERRELLRASAVAGQGGSTTAGTGSKGGAGAAGGTAGKGASGGSGGAGGAGGTAGTGGGGTGMEGGTAGSGTTTPRDDWASWPMPNPPSTGLPNPQSYTDNGDGTVLDNVTGLVWQKGYHANPRTWAGAKTYCTDNEAGLPGTGWQLPTAIELVSLVDYTTGGVTIHPSFFPTTPPECFWSSSPRAGEPSYTWCVTFDDGTTYSSSNGSTTHRVRCVQPAGARVTAHYEVVSDGVEDKQTGLVWQQPISGSSHTFESAASYCTTLGMGWRVPSMTELQTLVDRGTSSPSIDSEFFPSTPADYFWTSSRYVVPEATSYAWLINFEVGFTYYNVMDVMSSVRCVR